MKKSIVFLFILSCVCLSHAQQLPYKNATLTARQRAEDLCSRLTLKEKINLMSNGSPVNDKWGIPHFEWWSEALHGVGRNGYATVFPITTAMARASASVAVSWCAPPTWRLLPRLKAVCRVWSGRGLCSPAVGAQTTPLPA